MPTPETKLQTRTTMQLKESMRRGKAGESGWEAGLDMGRRRRTRQRRRGLNKLPKVQGRSRVRLRSERELGGPRTADPTCNTCTIMCTSVVFPQPSVFGLLWFN